LIWIELSDNGYSPTCQAGLRLSRSGYSEAGITPVDQGVPQGSVLGPLLFAAYMSPISRIIDHHGIRQQHYADDTSLYVEVDDPHNFPPPNLISCSNHLSAWCLSNHMMINPHKPEAILFGSSAMLKKFDLTKSIHLAGVDVPLQPTVKILGVTLDSTLSYDPQISYISQSVNFHTRALRHIRHMLPLNFASTLSCSVVASRLDYCNSILVNTSPHNILRLQRLQNKLARVVSEVGPRTDSLPLLSKLHWLPIRDRITFKCACLTHRSLQDDAPAYLHSTLTPYVPNRALRSSDSGLLTSPNLSGRLSIASRSFAVAAPQIWNELSIQTRLSSSYDSFRRALKTELMAATLQT